ncbi:family 16 glycosylhydrolase [Pseudomonadota bacterium]
MKDISRVKRGNLFGRFNFDSISVLPAAKSLALACLFLGAGSSAFADLLWSDEFETGTALDSKTWSYDLGSWGWGNQELQTYTQHPENVRLENGNLVINVRSTGEGASSQFTSARVRTQDKLTFKYGRIEARIKMPDLADGLWPAFWTLGNNFSQVGWPFCGELDIVEMGSSGAINTGLVNRRVGSTAHWDKSGNYSGYGQFIDAAVDLDDDYHLFSMDWTPEKVTTYIDGQQIWTMRIKVDQCASCSEFHKPHFMILNVAVGGTYTGLLNPAQITATTPAEMLVDYVRIYDNGYTQLGGSAAPVKPGIKPEYSGSWYNSEQSGHGFSMEFGEDGDGLPIAVIYWYTYDSLGNPIFMVGNGVPDGYTLDIQFESPHGMKYGEFDPDSVVRENGGTAHFEFTDKYNGTFNYTPSGFSTTAWGHVAPVENLPVVKIFSIPVTNTVDP